MEQRHKTTPAMKKTFEYILENIPDGTLLINAGTKKISLSNPLMCSMLRCTKKDLSRKDIYSIYPEESLSAGQDLYDQLIKNKTRTAKGVPVKRKDGSLFYADISASVIQYNDKPHLLAIFRDTTERIKAEEAIQISEERFRKLFMSLSEGFYLSEVIYDDNGNPCDYRYLEVNSRFEQIMGMSREQIIGRRYRELVPVNTTQWLDIYLKVAGTGEPMNYEFYSAEYKKNFMTYSYQLARGQIAVFVLDITGARQIEKELADIRILLDTAVSQTPIPMVIVSAPDNIVRFANSACLEYLGIQDEPDYVGKSLLNENPSWQDYDDQGNPIPLSEMPLALALRGIETKNREYCTKRKDGTIRWESVSGCPVRNSEGEIIAAYIIFPDITERKRAEDLLKQNEQMLQSILKAAPVGVALIKNRIFININPALSRITGYSEEDLLGKSTRILYPDDNEFNRIGTETYDQLRRNGLGISESRLKRKDGAPIYVLLGLSPFDPEDISEGVTATVMDITKRKEAEEDLKNSQNFLMNIIDQSPVSTGILDNMGTLIKMNNACRSLLNIKDEDVIGKYNVLKDNIVIDQGYLSLVKKVFENSEVVNFELVYDTSQLKHIHLSEKVSVVLNVTIFPIKNTNGIITNAVIQHNNITERKQAEESIKKSEDILKSLFNATPVGIGLLTNRIFVKVNNSMCRILGYPEEELLGKNARFIYFDEDEYNRVEIELYGQMNREGLGQMESRFKRSDGAVIDVLLSLSPFDRGNLSAGVTFAVLDITEAKKTGAEKARLEELLRRAQKMEAIGTMAGGIAHDFNNILAGIFGYSELCLTVKNNPPETDNYIHEVVKAAERAKGLINRILTFSRQAEHELKPIMPKYIIKEVLNLLRASTPAEVALNINIKSDSAILAEPTLIHQVILNLCSNAIYAMQSKPGSIGITVEDIEADEEFARLHPGLYPGKHIVIRISDSGGGIPPEIIDHIFDPFFTTKPQGEGTGLGLSVVHGIIKKLNGIITVYSEPGKGTTFNIIIPVIKDKAIEVDRSNSIVKGGNERILLVDDEESIIKSLGSILENLGYKVNAFTDSKDALHEFKTNPEGYDIIITDYSMPNMTGLELARELKEAKKDIPIIISSGYINKSLEESAYKEGISILLTKPVSTYQIADAIRRTLSG